MSDHNIIKIKLDEDATDEEKGNAIVKAITKMFVEMHRSFELDAVDMIFNSLQFSTGTIASTIHQYLENESEAKIRSIVTFEEMLVKKLKILKKRAEGKDGN